VFFWDIIILAIVKLAASCQLKLKMAKFYLLTESRRSRYITMPNFVKIGQSFALIFRFFKITAIRHLGFVLGHIWTTHKEYLVVCITAQNLVTVVSIIG